MEASKAIETQKVREVCGSSRVVPQSSFQIHHICHTLLDPVKLSHVGISLELVGFREAVVDVRVPIGAYNL
jgi:hypothetical protein